MGQMILRDVEILLVDGVPVGILFFKSEDPDAGGENPEQLVYFSGSPAWRKLELSWCTPMRDTPLQRRKAKITVEWED